MRLQLQIMTDQNFEASRETKRSQSGQSMSKLSGWRFNGAKLIASGCYVSNLWMSIFFRGAIQEPYDIGQPTTSPIGVGLGYKWPVLVRPGMYSTLAATAIWNSADYLKFTSIHLVLVGPLTLNLRFTILASERGTSESHVYSDWWIFVIFWHLESRLLLENPR